MVDGLQIVARVPYPVMEPRRLVTGNKVAIMDHFRSHGILVSRVYDCSTTSEHLASNEYVFVEYIVGTNLGDIWFGLAEATHEHLHCLANR